MLFLALPRELRDKIYHDYVYEDDGYHYNFTSGRLQASSGQKIDLALMYTCKSIAEEMHHIALESNVINFTTISSESVYTDAGRFDRYFRAVNNYKSGMLFCLKEPKLRCFVTPDLQAKVALRYPQFEFLFHEFHRLINSNQIQHSSMWYPFCKWKGNCSSYGEADSLFRGFQDHILQILFKDTTFYMALLDYCENGSGETGNRAFYLNIAQLLRTGYGVPNFDLWSIPSERELAEMDQFADPRHVDHEMWRCMKNRFSAAAAAIRFLDSIPAGTRAHIRNIVLHEDRQAVACPESHVHGLISFVSENPNLHISQRLDIWRLFVGGHCVHELITLDSDFEPWSPEDDCSSFEVCCPGLLGRYAGRWITEAAALFTNGMPAKAFSMILDGNTDPERTGILFDILKEEAAWQVAQIQWYAEKCLHPGPVYVRAGGFYRSLVFPQAISDVVEGISWIRCNFDPGVVYDPRLVLERNRNLEWNSQFPGTKWHHQWLLRNKYRFMPAPPAPRSLSNLRKYGIDELIPEKMLGIAPNFVEESASIFENRGATV